MNMHTHKYEDNDTYPTVFTVPIGKPFVVTKEEFEEMMKNAPKAPSTREEFAERRAEAIKRADRWRKPEKK